MLHGLEYAGMKFGDVVVIQGAGGLGIYAAAVAADKGASKVISIDGQTPRLTMAKNCGATDVIDMHEFGTPDARVARVRELTDGRGADIVVEVVGIAAATLEGLDMVRVNGDGAASDQPECLGINLGDDQWITRQVALAVCRCQVL